MYVIFKYGKIGKTENWPSVTFFHITCSFVCEIARMLFGFKQANESQATLSFTKQQQALHPYVR